MSVKSCLLLVTTSLLLGASVHAATGVPDGHKVTLETAGAARSPASVATRPTCPGKPTGPVQFIGRAIKVL